jgi:hypothetical protein
MSLARPNSAVSSIFMSIRLSLRLYAELTRPENLLSPADQLSSKCSSLNVQADKSNYWVP